MSDSLSSFELFNIYQGISKNDYTCVVNIKNAGSDTSFRITLTSTQKLSFGLGIGLDIRYYTLYKKCSSLREQMLEYDNIFDSFDNYPILYTVFDKEDSSYKIAMFDDSGKMYLFNTESNQINPFIDLKNDANILITGKNTERFQIYKEYDTVKEAIESDEMLSYMDVLSTL